MRQAAGSGFALLLLHVWPALADWSRVTNEQWQASLGQVNEILEHVQPEFRTRCGNVLRGSGQPGFSQAWQDWMLWRNFFAGRRKRGVYLDIGTNRAITISNTAFFDVCLGWTGVCFEPQQQYHDEIRARRNCTLVPHCVLGQPATVVSSNKGSQMTLTKASSTTPASSALQCVGIQQELTRLQLHGQAIDFLSIDIEGNEPSVLRCFPWEKLQVDMVLIETNHHDLRLVDTFFNAHGYANAATMLQVSVKNGQHVWLDNLYVRMPGGRLIKPPGTLPPWVRSGTDWAQCNIKQH